MIHSGSQKYDPKKLKAINLKLNSLYNSIYRLKPSLQEEIVDISSKMDILLSTINEFCKISKHKNFDREISIQIEDLKMNYAALYELNSDLKNFAIITPETIELQNLLDIASASLQKVKV